MRKEVFGEVAGLGAVEKYTLEGGDGAEVEVLTLGGIVSAVRVPDRSGKLADVALGFSELDPYLGAHPYFGAIVGRVAGRIPGGHLCFGGRTYQLECNEGGNHLHGGFTGLDKRLWAAQSGSRADGADALILRYTSPAGDQGYPGTVAVAVTYTFTRENVLVIESEVEVDSVTPVSLTHHGYFHLGGEGEGDVGDHEVSIASAKCFEVDEAMAVTGRLVDCAGTAADLRAGRRLGEVLPDLRRSHGDLYFLTAAPGGEVVTVARVLHPASGRTLTVSTNEACLQFYTGVSLNGAQVGKSGRPYERHGGFCLECEGYPGGAGLADFGSILVEPGRTQRRETRYEFGCQSSGDRT